MKSINSIIKANRFLIRLNGNPLSKLSEQSLRELVGIYYPRIKVRGGSCNVTEAPRENLYRVAERLHERAKKIVSKDPRQFLYRNLLKLRNIIYTLLSRSDKEASSHSSLREEMEILEERVCIQFEGCNIEDEELDEYYNGLKKRKEALSKSYI